MTTKIQYVGCLLKAGTNGELVKIGDVSGIFEFCQKTGRISHHKTPAGGLPANPLQRIVSMNVNDLKIGQSVFFWPNPTRSAPLECHPIQARVTGISQHSGGADWNISLDSGCWTKPLSVLFPTDAHARLHRIQELAALGNEIFNLANRMSLVGIPAEYEMVVTRKLAPADCVGPATLPLSKAA